MPNIFTKNGFRIVIYPNDHEPIHVHIHKAGSEIRINVLNLKPMSVKGSIGNRDIKKALKLVEEQQKLIIEKWCEINGKN